MMCLDASTAQIYWPDGYRKAIEEGWYLRCQKTETSLGQMDEPC